MFAWHENLINNEKINKEALSHALLSLPSKCGAIDKGLMSGPGKTGHGKRSTRSWVAKGKNKNAALFFRLIFFSMYFRKK